MPLRFLTPPQASFDRVASSVGRVAAGGAGIQIASASVPPAPQAFPHPVYALGLTDIVNGAGIADAKQVSWRYLLDGSDGALVAAEVSASRPDDPISLNRGRAVGGTRDQVTTSNVDARFATDDYEVKLLRVPALSLVFLWLEAPSDEVFIAIEPTFPPFKVGETYSRADLEQALRAPAAERLKHDDSPT